MFKRLVQKANTFSARLIEKSIQRATRKQPRDAITFQNRLFRGQVDVAEVQRIKRLFRFKDIYLFHGIAMKINGSAVILTGPRGAGKTTVMRTLSKKGKATPLDDGIIIVGRNNNGLFVVESGTFPWRNTIANIKRFSPVKGQQISKKGLVQNTNRIQQTAIYEGAISETIASLIIRDKSQQTHSPTLTKIGKLIQVSSKVDLHPAMKLQGIRFEPATEMDLTGVKVTTITPNQRRSRIIAQMKEDALRN